MGLKSAGLKSVGLGGAVIWFAVGSLINKHGTVISQGERSAWWERILRRHFKLFCCTHRM